MVKFTPEQIALIVNRLPGRLIRALFIHGKMTMDELTDIDLFYHPAKVARLFNSSAQDTPEWLDTINLLTEKGGIYNFLSSDTDDANSVWDGLIARDYSPRSLLPTHEGMIPFNEFRYQYIKSSPYQAATRRERYLALCTLDYIDEYLYYSELRKNFAKELYNTSDKDLAEFKKNLINNVQKKSRSDLINQLKLSDDLESQWQHTLNLFTESNTKVSLNLTLLMAAASHGDVGMMRVLVEYGADVNTRRHKRILDTAISAALYYRHAEAANYLLDRNPALMLEKNPECDDHQSILIWALKYGHDKIIRYMLMHKINVNDQERGNLCTPLMYASLKGNMNHIERLIELGADLNMADKGGFRASDYARKGGHLDVRDFLFQREAPDTSLVSRLIRFTTSPTIELETQRHEQRSSCSNYVNSI